MRRSSTGAEWPRFEFSPQRRGDDDVVISESPFKNVVIDLTVEKRRVPATTARKRKKPTESTRRKTVVLSFERTVNPLSVPPDRVEPLVEHVYVNQQLENADKNAIPLVKAAEFPATPEKNASCQDMFDDESLSPALDDTFRIQTKAKALRALREEKPTAAIPALTASSSVSIVVDPESNEQNQSLPSNNANVSIEESQRQDLGSSVLSLHVSSIEDVDDDSESRPAWSGRSTPAPPDEWQPTTSEAVERTIGVRMRRSFVRGGLADQLYRAVHGAKSERTVWLQAVGDQRRIPELVLRIDQIAGEAWGLIRLRSTDPDGCAWDVLMRRDWLPRATVLTVGSWLWVYKPTVIVAASVDRFDRSLLVCPPLFRVDSSAPGGGERNRAPPRS